MGKNERTKITVLLSGVIPFFSSALKKTKTIICIRAELIDRFAHEAMRPLFMNKAVVD